MHRGARCASAGKEESHHHVLQFDFLLSFKTDLGTGLSVAPLSPERKLERIARNLRVFSMSYYSEEIIIFHLSDLDYNAPCPVLGDCSPTFYSLHLGSGSFQKQADSYIILF